jgi:hypothetical protein
MQRLDCVSCKSTLGQEATSGAIELYKYSIRPQFGMQATPCSMLGMIIANDLVRLSQAHATRHFLLLSLDHEKNDKTVTPLHLWLFLEAFQVAVNLPTSFDICGLESANDKTSVSLSACKIMYRQGTLEDSATNSSWSQPDLVEQLRYPLEVCRQIRQLLQDSNLCYPPSRRQFAADWSVGFLQTTATISTF